MTKIIHSFYFTIFFSSSSIISRSCLENVLIVVWREFLDVKRKNVTHRIAFAATCMSTWPSIERLTAKSHYYYFIFIKSHNSRKRKKDERKLLLSLLDGGAGRAGNWPRPASEDAISARALSSPKALHKDAPINAATITIAPSKIWDLRPKFTIF